MAVIRVGEAAWLLELASLEAAHAANARLRALGLAGVRDLVAGARSVLVVFDEETPPDDATLAALESAARARPGESGLAPRVHEIAVFYDGPDLDELAQRAGLSPEELARRHARSEYRVAFLGFQPGFAYLAGLPEALRAPRRATPRARVPAGSVAIGGEWTGIYPANGPGGWNLIGRCDVRLFDPTRDPPCLLAAGDLVRFHRG